MIISLDKKQLLDYTSRQLNYFFPDNNSVDLASHASEFDVVIDRLDYCFKQVAYPSNRYNKEGNTLLNHLYADHYLMYLWFLSNSIWRSGKDLTIASKLYYLNKALHGFDCMFDTSLPNIFLVFHGVGTMLGKAAYSDFFVCLQGCTIGSDKNEYPVLGKGVSLTAHSSIIGACKIGDRVSISNSTSVYKTDVASDHVVFRDASGKINHKISSEPYAQKFFNKDLKDF